jgi:hypothetical protein
MNNFGDTKMYGATTKIICFICSLFELTSPKVYPVSRKSVVSSRHIYGEKYRNASNKFYCGD